MFTHYVGVDLGQARDYTAICVVEEQLWVPDGPWLDRLCLSPGVWLSPATLGPAVVEDLISIAYHHGRPASPPLVVNHLERIALGTSYPAVVERVATLLRTPQLRGARTCLVVDQTGVGRPVVDQLRQASLEPVAVTITAGTATTRDGESGDIRTPKRDLIASTSIVLEQRRITIAAGLSESDTLKRELETFRRTVSPNGDDSYSAWRESDHDDLVLAVALAVWYRGWFCEHLDRVNAAADRRQPAGRW